MKLFDSLFRKREGGKVPEAMVEQNDQGAGTATLPESGPAVPIAEKPSQLLSILGELKASPKIYAEITAQLLEKNPDKFKSEAEVTSFVEAVQTPAGALVVAKLIDKTLGTGAFRTMSFLGSQQNAERSVLRLLRDRIENSSFEKQAERGMYLNLLETYGVEWSMEKASRDCLQNFFDANDATLDGVKIETSLEEKATSDAVSIKIAKVRISAPQHYDWREMFHLGGSTKTGSETAVGGFGEGIKVAAFVLLKDHGATQVRASSGEWQVDYYFSNLPSDAYRKPVRGLYGRKRDCEAHPGNYLELVFEGPDADKKIEAFQNVRELFYSSENEDFQGASFDNKASGGFKVLPKAMMKSPWGGERLRNQAGHLYLAGQRTHYDERKKWETVPDVNIWTWRKVQPKDRDRGMLTRDEMEKDVIPLIINSMTDEEAKKSVYDFKPLWDTFDFVSTGEALLKKIAEKLEKKGTTLAFEEGYLANDLPFSGWIVDALKQQGFKMCGAYMGNIGMKTAKEKFLEMQSHNRVESTDIEQERIKILQEAAQSIGMEKDDIKEVWLFSQKDEKNIFSGQYNGMFFWMTTEEMAGNFYEALNTYVHEAAHKKGPHGEAQFEYYLEQCKQKITKYILEHKAEWDEMDKKWNELAVGQDTRSMAVT